RRRRVLGTVEAWHWGIGTAHGGEMTENTKQIPEHLLGYRLDPKWRDMSNFVVHFTKTEQTLSAILQEGEIRAGGPFGSARNLPLQDSQKCVCLSESNWIGA